MLFIPITISSFLLMCGKLKKENSQVIHSMKAYKLYIKLLHNIRISEKDTKKK